LSTTLYYVASSNGPCESTRTSVTATIDNCDPPVITPHTLATEVGGIITIDLKPLISTANLVLTSLQIIVSPGSGAAATIDAQGILSIDYAGRTFAGVEAITIEACDLNGKCSQQELSIEVASDIIVYNGVSPGGKNPILRFEYIELLPETQHNKVTIYSRWGDEVFSVSDYDNASRVFRGEGAGGGKLPAGTYYYKVTFASGRKTMSGFLEVRY
jgi:hypothetical protein